MELHTGRPLDHAHVRVADLEASRAFYRAVLAVLGRELTFEHDQAFALAAGGRDNGLPGERAYHVHNGRRRAAPTRS